jgi:branched-chain amino acid transport system permease protein
VTLIWGGLSLGAVYALVAVGYNIVFTASGTFNFAHAQLLMLGTFLAYWGLAVLKWPVLAVFALAAVVVGAVAVAEERFAVRTVRGIEAQLVTTVGVATLINGASQLIWGSQARTVPFFSGSGTGTSVWTLLGGRVLPVEVALIVVAIVLALGLIYYSRHSMIGLAVLAMAENREAAALRGINVRMLTLGAFAVSGVLAGAVGPVVGPKTFAVATLGSALALKGFVALALGGFGSIGGGVVGGFAIGVIEQYAARYLGSTYVNLTIFGVLLLILLARPAGLFGRTQERMV